MTVSFRSTVLLFLAAAASARAEEPASQDGTALPFLKNHCVRCHGPNKQSGRFRLDDLTADVGGDIDRWLLIREQVHAGSMPPEKEPQPTPADRKTFLAWLNARTATQAARLPNQGNLVPHDLLFGSPPPPSRPAPARIWRLAPESYHGLVRDLTRGNLPKAIVQPFTLVPDRGIKDFAGLYTIDEPSTEILLRNAEIVVDAMTAHDLKNGRVQGRNDTVREFVALMDPRLDPDRKQVEAALAIMFRMTLGRTPSPDETGRFLGLYDKAVSLGSKPAALKTMLQAVLLRADAMYRGELGSSDDDGELRLLTPLELSRAIALALGDRRDHALQNAADKNALSTRKQVADHVRRLLDDPRREPTRILRFFREYFEYGKAVDIFKDKPKDFVHAPQVLVADTDRLILHLLQEDRDVLRRLLTTDLTFANYSENKQRRNEGPKPAVKVNPNNNKGQKAPEYVYGLERWTPKQPTQVPQGRRLGILMQPSWLVAHATNFDNDPVRRGRWIRERLLGGTVPELPIGVAAQVPDDKHHTFRTRLQVTRAVECWKCHRLMDDLGLPFEQFDHYGLFRTAELVLDPDATAKNVDKRGKHLGPVERKAPLDTTGTVDHTADPKLDGAVRNPHELVRRLAESDRVRQVFVRHAFRYFLGRNETLGDARTLQEADRAYVAAGGSFKALVVSLLTSDAFLYRRSPSVQASAPGAP